MSTTTILLTGILVNIITCLLIILRRYIPAFFKLKIQRYNIPIRYDPVTIVLTGACIVMIIIPFVFTLFIIMSFKPQKD